MTRFSCLLASMALFLPLATAAAEVIIHPAADTASFDERRDWAQGTAANRGSAWIGYAIEHWTEADRYFHSGPITIVNDRVIMHGEPLTALLGAATPSFPNDATTPPLPGLERRPLAILLLVSDGEVRESMASSIEYPVPLQGHPLLWLGTAETSEGVTLLEDLYRRTGGTPGRIELVETIGLHQTPRALDLLAGVLEATDTPSKLRAEAAEALGDSVDERSLPLLHQVAKGDVSTDVREEAVEALGDSRLTGAEPLLVELAQEADRRSVRAEAIEALAKRGTDQAVAVVRRILWDDDDREVQEEAVDAIEDLPIDRALPILREVAERHPVPAIREEALDSLADLEPEASLDLFRQIAMNDGSADVREEAVEAIAEMADDLGLPVLIDIARNHPDRQTRREAISALADKAGDRVVEVLQEVVYNDQQAEVREQALKALGELPAGEGIAIVAKVAQTHPDASLREEAIDVLADMAENDARAREALRLMISNSAG